MLGNKAYGQKAMKIAAHCYWKQGLNIVLLFSKTPLHEWAQWQDNRQNESDFTALPWNRAESFAVICGSGLVNRLYICAIDFDVKNVTLEAIEKGKQLLKHARITQIEETPSGGQHWIYFSRVKPRTISAFHSKAAVELLGESKLCIMAPSKGYRRLNDNPPTVLTDIEIWFNRVLQSFGMRTGQRQTCSWFEGRYSANKAYYGREPPCIVALMKGVKQGIRNEAAIRVAGYLLNFKKLDSKKAWISFNRWNRRNKPPLDMNELGVIFNSALKGQYDFGCEDPLLNQSCNESICTIFKRRMQAFKRAVATL